MKTLIAYYSKSGTTAKAAKELQRITGGDTFEIRGTKDYGSYVHCLGVARKEFSSGELPEVVGDVEDFASYDRIFIGYPVWYSKCPQLVVSFMSAHDFAGKEVYPFCTSGRSGPEGAKEQFAKGCEGADLHDGLRLNKFDDAAVKAWIGEK